MNLDDCYGKHGINPAEVLPDPDQVRLAKIAAELERDRKSLPIPAYQKPVDKWLNEFITQDLRMNLLKQKIRILSPTKYNVVIQGESGTGKEILARALHGNRSGEFIALNCGGFPPELIDSELFGHTRGSFTGAITEKIGALEAAKDGTLFLDEIGELPFLMQVKLLRALQERKIRKVGAVTEQEVNCRFIAATNCDLLELVKQHKFRLDLYWRLRQGVILYTVPLRERLADIPLITKSLGLELTAEEFVNNPLYGNVRELQSLVIEKQIFKVLQ